MTEERFSAVLRKGLVSLHPFVPNHLLWFFRSLLSVFALVFVLCSAINSALRNCEGMLAIGEESFQMPSLEPGRIRPRSGDTHR